MNGWREIRIALAVRLVIWVISRYLENRYRLVSPEQLNKVVDDYLADLQKIGVRLVLDKPQVGESNDEVNDSHRNP